MRRGVTLRGLVCAFVLALLMLAPVFLWAFGITPAKSPPPVLPPSIAVIESMSELATTRVHISDFIDGENEHWRGRWTLHGEVLLGVDLSAVKYAQATPEKKEAVLLLPQPHVLATKVDHERSEEVFVKAVSWVPVSTTRALRDEVWKHGDRKIRRLGEEVAYKERARIQTEKVLGKLFKDAGWTVRFEWQERPPAAFPAEKTS